MRSCCQARSICNQHCSAISICLSFQKACGPHGNAMLTVIPIRVQMNRSMRLESMEMISKIY